MNYRMIREQVLKLLNQHPIAGTPVAATYNNQQDYLNRIPSLCNDAMMEIATTVRKLPATMTLENGEEIGDLVRYPMPDDFYQFCSGDTLHAAEHESLQDAVERDEKVKNLKKQIEVLQARIRKEKQLNVQMKLNTELKKLKKELEVL